MQLFVGVFIDTFQVYIQCVAMCCNVLKYVAVSCSVLQLFVGVFIDMFQVYM